MLPFEVPYLSREALDEAAADLLRRYSAWKHEPARPPIDVDEIAEGLLKLDLEVADLRGLLGMGDVLGATWLEEGRICVDQSLEGLEGRFAFTVAHELGHWELHRPLLLKHRATLPLFAARPGDDRGPVIICRAREVRADVERQADRFAAGLLMPATDVRLAHRARFGGAPVALAGLDARRRLGGLPDEARDVAGAVLVEGRFANVSNEAMCYRLFDLGLVVDSAQSELMLF